MNLKIVAIVGFIIALSVGGLYYIKNKGSSKEIYSEIKMLKSSIKVEIQATGTVQPENRLEIKPPIPGRVESLLVKEGDNVEKGQILAWMSSTERAALLDAARAQGEAELQRWEGLYRPTPIISPLSGTVILKGVEPGQTITSADPIVALSNRLTIKAQVDETDIGKIKLDQNADAIMDAYSNIKIPAKVSLIAYEAKTVNNVTTYVVDVTPLETPEVMRSGMTANVNFILESRDNINTLPNYALIYRGENVGVYTIGDKGQKQFHKIEVGITDGRITEILSGLSESDTIVYKDVDLGPSNISQGTNPFAPNRPRANRQRSNR